MPSNRKGLGCPFCRHPRSDIVRTRLQPSGATLRYRQCLGCGKRFYALQEPEYLIRRDQVARVAGWPYLVEELAALPEEARGVHWSEAEANHLVETYAQLRPDWSAIQAAMATAATRNGWPQRTRSAMERQLRRRRLAGPAAVAAALLLLAHGWASAAAAQVVAPAAYADHYCRLRRAGLPEGHAMTRATQAALAYGAAPPRAEFYGTTVRTDVFSAQVAALERCPDL